MKRFSLLLLLSLYSSFSVASALSAEQWIWKMSQAMEALTYEGTYVYVHDNEVESMKVRHDNHLGEVRERLFSLNGEARVIVRDSEAVTCIWPGSKSVIVSESHPRIAFPQFDAEKFKQYAKYYHFELQDNERVAGRVTRKVNVQPVDEYRYGFKLWIDESVHILLRSMLLDNQQQPIEQILFTSIDFPQSIDDKYFITKPKEVDYTWQQIDKRQQMKQYDKRYQVQFGFLPDGFVITEETYQPMPMMKAPVHHLMLSDGLASVSVYIEYGPALKKVSYVGRTSMGAIHAYSKFLDDAYITVVGEVPMVTVKHIGDALQLERQND